MGDIVRRNLMLPTLIKLTHPLKKWLKKKYVTGNGNSAITIMQSL